MYSKILACIVACCIVSFCDSADTVGSYNELILVQHLTSDFGWVVAGLWGTLNNRLLIRCNDAHGDPLVYDHGALDAVLRYGLQTNWPAVRAGQTEAALWSLEYETFGSCVEDEAPAYFAKALRLFEANKGRKILRDARVEPGTSLPHDRLFEAVRAAAGALVHLKCVRNQDTGKQHLVGLALCFDADRELQDCSLSQQSQYVDRCESGNIYYPHFHELDARDLERRFMDHYNLH